MNEGCNLASRFRFSKFEVDVSSGELLKQGYRVKLQPQPFQVLAVLLERPGEVVTREVLRARVWPSDTYVDFDHSLNKAVNKIRDALGDSSERPLFVETLARRGYRFIAPVEQLNGGPASTTDFIPPTPQVSRRRPRWPAWLAAGCVAAAVLAIGGLALREKVRSMPALTRLTADAGLTTDPAFAPDGRLLAYSSDRGSDRLHIWVQQVATGGQALQVTHGDRNDIQPAFSPDGTKIAYRSEGVGVGVYIVPAIGGTPVPVAEEGRNPRFSPDGKWISYWIGRGWIKLGCIDRGKAYLAPASGGPAVELKANLANVASPVWSPDGKYLLLLGEKELSATGIDNADWWVVPVGGGTPVKTGAFESFRRQGLKLRPMETRDPMPFPREWTEAGILFSASSGDSIDLWRVAITLGSWRIETRAERLSSVPGSAQAGTSTRDGRIAFANLTSRTHLWSLRADPDKGLVTGSLEQITNSDVSEVWPSISLDGRVLAYTKSSAGNYDVWVRDLKTGQESPLATTGADEVFPRVSLDGQTVAYTIRGAEHEGLYVSRAGVSQPRKVTGATGGAYGVSPNGRYLLTIAGDVRRAQLADTDSGEVSEILQDPDQDLFQSNFSPDGRWIVFMDMQGLLVASFRGPGVIPKEKWIRITSGGEFDDKPRWSPNGNSIIFTSDRDGLRCLWMQRLNPVTKQPIGSPQAIFHLHDPRRSLEAANFIYSELALARDRLVFPLGEVTGNIWMMEPGR